MHSTTLGSLIKHTSEVGKMLRSILTSKVMVPSSATGRLAAMRALATKPQKKPEPKPVDEKAKEAKKKAGSTWSVKNEEKDKSADFFIRLMLSQEQRYAAVRKVKRSKTRTLWEKLAAKRYQMEASREQNRADFAMHCAIRIRDDAIAALPTPELRREALLGNRPFRHFPLSRKAATWTPPLPETAQPKPIKQ